MEFFCYDTTVRIVVQIIAVRIAEPQINTDSIQFLIVLFPYAFAIFPPYMFSIFTESFYTGSQIFLFIEQIGKHGLGRIPVNSSKPTHDPAGIIIDRGEQIFRPGRSRCKHFFKIPGCEVPCRLKTAHGFPLILFQRPALGEISFILGQNVLQLFYIDHGGFLLSDSPGRAWIHVSCIVPCLPEKIKETAHKTVSSPYRFSCFFTPVSSAIYGGRPLLSL